MTIKRAGDGALLPAEAVAHFTFVAPPDVTLVDVEDQRFWMKHADTFRAKPFALIRVIARCGRWEKLLRVADVTESGFVEVEVISQWRTTITRENCPALPDGYRAELLADGWCLWGPDNLVVRKGIVRITFAHRLAASHAIRKGRVAG